MLPWIEKYRPIKVKDVLLEDILLKRIEKMIEHKDLPNIIMTGTPGIGKTTTIYCIANEILGENLKDNLLEINASDERGKQTVEIVIKNFCCMKLPSNIKFKLIILDEADNMTPKAQNLISLLMEHFENKIKFLFTCNDQSKILESIQSKCLILNFKGVDNKKIIQRMKYICDNENVKYDNECLEEITKLSKGDVRNSINILQIISDVFSHVSIENLYKIHSKPQQSIIDQLFFHCDNNDLQNAIKIYVNMKNNGYTNDDILYSMLDYINNTLAISEMKKMIYRCIINKTQYQISICKESNTQLVGCIAELCN